jgi:hypothetical protein
MEFDQDRRFLFNSAQTTFRTPEELKIIIGESLREKDLSEQYTKEVYFDFLEAYDSILFIQNLVSNERKRACDLKRWDDPYNKTRREIPDGRIAVNIHNPHILEDMDYFRQAAIRFQATGRYTHLYPNSNPNSEYAQFWQEEARRCREGMVREYDGEWIPGYFYFYLNYSYIKRNIRKGGKTVRTEGFPDIYDGDYLFFHYLEKARRNGKHTATLKKRGSGFSFKGGSKLSRNFILGETEISKEKTKSFAIANEKEYLVKDGVLNKFLDITDFCADNTPWPRIREAKDSMNEMGWMMGYKDSNTGRVAGVRNTVNGVTLKNDPHRARGKRGILIEWEEVGSFQDFLTAWAVARPSVEEDDQVFGLMNAYGTGGEEGVDFEGLQQIFYNPRGYNIQHMPNVFDKNTNGSTESAFFFGQYLNAAGCYDKNGNSDVVKALIKTFVRRINVKYNTSDPNAIVQEKAERPITPQEAVMRTEGTAFPIGALKETLEKIMVNYQQHCNEHYIGKLVYDNNGNVEWKPDTTISPIHKFPLKDNKNNQGALEIFEMPKKDRSGKVYRNRYIIGADPIDNDYTLQGSLASVFVFDLLTDRIVAEYSGRPVLASEFYDVCIMLCEFYNAQLNYENNLKGLYIHFSNLNKTHLLYDTPQLLRDMEIVKDTLHGNRAKGTRTNKQTIALGKTLQRSWMLGTSKYVDEKGEEQTYQNYEKIRSIPYLQECITWNPDGNFDRVSAMDMVMIMREDMDKIKFSYEQEKERAHFENDEFVDKNWNRIAGQIAPKFKLDDMRIMN